MRPAYPHSRSNVHGPSPRSILPGRWARAARMAVSSGTGAKSRSQVGHSRHSISPAGCSRRAPPSHRAEERQ
jgi:hypothetical protein